ncbi:MAG: hypothetical protein KF683_04065 [Rubrivivax sp.]|nr:hypothetical protein [Rubrivivax sp.]
MNRCAALLSIAALLLATTLPAAAQAQRNFPANALRGELVIQQPPEALLNGRAARLAPGARIRGADNLLQMSGALAGQKLPVHYTLDNAGHLLDIWVLTPAELARRPWPTTPKQASEWVFDPVAQVWSRP